MTEVLDVVPTANRKNFVVLEVLVSKELHLSMYSVKNGERRSMKLTGQVVRKARLLETGEPLLSLVWMQLAEDQHHIVQVDLQKMRVATSAFSSEQLVSVHNH